MPAMTELTPQEFELHLKDLRDRLRALLDKGEGSSGELRREAEELLLMAGGYPGVYERYPNLPGLVADLLAREKQKEYVAAGPRGEAPGCLLGWLLRRKKR
jgi:hypothetical protein